MGVGGVDAGFPIKVISKLRRKGSLFYECEISSPRDKTKEKKNKKLKLSLFLCSLIQTIFNPMRISSN